MTASDFRANNRQASIPVRFLLLHLSELYGLCCVLAEMAFHPPPSTARRDNDKRWQASSVDVNQKLYWISGLESFPAIDSNQSLLA
jgi:hypothetical protein